MPCFPHCFRTDTDEGFRFNFSSRKNRSGINFIQSNQRTTVVTSPFACPNACQYRRSFGLYRLRRSVSPLGGSRKTMHTLAASLLRSYSKPARK